MLSNLKTFVSYKIYFIGNAFFRNEILRCFDVVNAPRCPPGKTGCTDSCIYRHQPAQVKQLPEPSLEFIWCYFLLILKKDFARFLALHDLAQTFAISATLEKKRQGKRLENLLTLDGGGVRGLVLIQVIFDINKHFKPFYFFRFRYFCASKSVWMERVYFLNSIGLREQVREQLLLPLCALVIFFLLFQLFFAFSVFYNSTGRTLKECQRLYFRFKDDVFGSGSRPYDTNILENFLKFEIGAHKTMADVKNCK